MLREEIFPFLMLWLSKKPRRSQGGGSHVMRDNMRIMIELFLAGKVEEAQNTQLPLAESTKKQKQLIEKLG